MLAAALRFLVILAVAGLVASCGGGGKSRDHYPTKGDSDPHPGVARAHRMPIHGIDLSRYQGDVDWQAVRQAGTQFAFIKATEGGDYVDPKFLEYWHGAKRAGIPRGAYHFVYWCRPAYEQALWFMHNVPNDPQALPPVLDLEWNGHSKTCPRKVPREQALELTRFLLSIMEAHTGKKPIIYTDITFHKEVLEGEFPGYHFWLRSVAAEPHERYDNRKPTFWQFTATGRVPGITGNVDRNAFMGDRNDWLRFLGY